MHFQLSSFLLSLCGTKCKDKKTAGRNGNNYCLNGFLRVQFLDNKPRTTGIVLFWRIIGMKRFYIIEGSCFWDNKKLSLDDKDPSMTF